MHCLPPLRFAHVALPLFLLACLHVALAYDPLDPLGNVTIVWDVVNVTSETTYTVNVSIVNLQQFRDVRDWHLHWTWPGDEFIGQARGAEATNAGDCKTLMIRNKTSAHSCSKDPVMVDLPLTDKPPVPGCCRNGVLRSLLGMPNETTSVFQIDVANTKLENNTDKVLAPLRLKLLGKGFHCSAPFPVAPLNHTLPGSRRVVPSIQTWNVVCSYRRGERETPQCCVSFSAFYSSSVIPCPKCACACGDLSPSSSLCLIRNIPGTRFPFLSDAQSVEGASSLPQSLVCSPDGCGVHVRFHVKANYKGHWRAKVTLFNREFQHHHEDWTLIVQHPNMGSVEEVLSFNTSFIQPYGVNNTGVFKGLPGYNNFLLSASNLTGPALVQSEMLFKKSEDFTLRDGWAFPRKVVFQGQECTLPREFPPLPEAGNSFLRRPI